MIALNIPGLPEGVDGWAFLLFFAMMAVFIFWSINPYSRWLHLWQCPRCHRRFWSRRRCEDHLVESHWKSTFS